MTIRSPRGGARPGAGRPPGPGGARSTVVRLPLPLAAIAKRIRSGGWSAGDVNAFLDVDARTVLTVPLMSDSAACGFPSPADDYMDRPLDFNELLVRHPSATFAVRIAGDSMTGIGMFPGDIAVVDRSEHPFSGKVVLALLDGGFTIKTYRRKGDVVTLEPANPAFKPTTVTEDAAFEVWGVVTHSIRVL